MVADLEGIHRSSYQPEFAPLTLSLQLQRTPLKGSGAVNDPAGLVVQKISKAQVYVLQYSSCCFRPDSEL
jgi:hypothetical protein